MNAVPQFVVLGAVFGFAGWAGHALTAAAPEEAPAPAPAPYTAPAEPSPPAPLGDLDAGGPPAKPAPAAGEPIRLTFNDISQWDLDPKDVQVPASIRALAGKAVDIVGYMIPYGDADAVEEFLLVRDLGSCCFGAAPLPHHLIECRMDAGKRTVYLPGPVRVRGRFRVEEHRQGQFLISVFAMTVSDCVEVR